MGGRGRGELRRAGRCRCPDLRRGGSHWRRGLGAEVDGGAYVAAAEEDKSNFFQTGPLQHMVLGTIIYASYGTVPHHNFILRTPVYQLL